MLSARPTVQDLCLSAIRDSPAPPPAGVFWRLGIYNHDAGSSEGLSLSVSVGEGEGVWGIQEICRVRRHVIVRYGDDARY